MSLETEPDRELFLGNKQLLSMFFVGAVLLGIAFTIGYIMGKNTATKIGDGNPVNPQSHVAAPRTEERLPTEEAAPPVRETAPPPSSEVPAAAPNVTASEPAPSAPSPAKAGAGSYLQVAALKREDADHIVNTLRKRGFPALVGESSKEGLFRVLVGPFASMAELSESKQKLKAAGMDSILVR